MKKTCEYCKEEFETKSHKAKYCSDAHKMAARRGATPQDNSTPKKIQESPEKIEEKPKVLDHPIKRPPKPDYMTDIDYSRWDGVECKFGACLNKDCPYRV